MATPNLNLTKIENRELTGTIFSNEGEVEIVEMRLSNFSVSKIAATIHSGTVNRENQDLFIESITINKKDDALFAKGQSLWEKTQYGYAVSSTPRNPKRFRGELMCLVPDGCGRLVACKVNIGGIEFDLANCNRSEYGDFVEYENVSAIVYPTGQYTVEELKD